MKLPLPSAPFSRVPIYGESITIDVDPDPILLVTPTGNQADFPDYNEYISGRSLITYNSKLFSDEELLLMGHNWFIIFDPSNNYVDFFLFSNRLKSLQTTASPVDYLSSDGIEYYSSDSLQYYPVTGFGYISQISFSVLNGVAYHGRFYYHNLTLDASPVDYLSSDGIEYYSSDSLQYYPNITLDFVSTGIPNFLRLSVIGSLPQFLNHFDIQDSMYFSSDDMLYLSSDKHTIELKQ